MILYLTNKALTKGIVEIDTESERIVVYGDGIHRKVYATNANCTPVLIAGASDIFEDKKDAVKRAKQLVKNRVNFHKRKIKELEGMKFE